jgi:acyl carrier protein
VELVAFLESEFHIKFTEDEIVGSSLNTLANMIALVRSKTRGHA